LTAFGSTGANIVAELLRDHVGVAVWAIIVWPDPEITFPRSAFLSAAGDSRILTSSRPSVLRQIGGGQQLLRSTSGGVDLGEGPRAAAMRRPGEEQKSVFHGVYDLLSRDALVKNFFSRLTSPAGLIRVRYGWSD